MACFFCFGAANGTFEQFRAHILPNEKDIEARNQRILADSRFCVNKSDENKKSELKLELLCFGAANGT